MYRNDDKTSYAIVGNILMVKSHLYDSALLHVFAYIKESLLTLSCGIITNIIIPIIDFRQRHHVHIKK